MLERDLEIIRDNMSALAVTKHSCFEKHISQLNELARALSEEASEEEIFFRDDSFRQSYLRLFERETVECASFNRMVLEERDILLSLHDRAILCKGLCDILGISGLRSVSTFFDEAEDGEGDICYARNPYADEAYLRLSEGVRNPRAVYGEDYAQVCESVYYGRSTYCILPVSSSSDGRLAGFRNLVIKYGLKTVCITGVNTNDGETVFALMKKELELPKSSEGALFEFRIASQGDVCDILEVARGCHMDTVAVSASPDAHGGNDMILTVSEEGICGFLVYLNLEHPDFVPVGIYRRI